MRTVDDIISSDKKNVAKKITNFLLVLTNIWIAILVAAVLLSRESIMSLWQTFSPQQTLVMGSRILEILVREEFVILPVLFLTALVIKEFKIKQLQKRIKANLIMLAGAVFYFILLMFLLFMPVFQAL
jgi:preprotein translocase subunit SecG